MHQSRILLNCSAGLNIDQIWQTTTDKSSA